MHYVHVKQFPTYGIVHLKFCSIECINPLGNKIPTYINIRHIHKIFTTQPYHNTNMFIVFSLYLRCKSIDFFYLAWTFNMVTNNKYLNLYSEFSSKILNHNTSILFGCLVAIKCPRNSQEIYRVRTW